MALYLFLILAQSNIVSVWHTHGSMTCYPAPYLSIETSGAHHLRALWQYQTHGSLNLGLVSSTSKTDAVPRIVIALQVTLLND